MANKSEILPVNFDGKDYFLWEFHFWNFVEGKELWGFINGSIMMQVLSKEREKDKESEKEKEKEKRKRKGVWSSDRRYKVESK